MGLYYPEPSLEPGEREILRCAAKRRTKLLSNPGRLVLTDRRIVFLPANSGLLKLASTVAGQPWLGALTGAVDASELGKQVAVQLRDVADVSPIGRWDVHITAGGTFRFMIMKHDLANAHLRDEVVRRVAAAVKDAAR